MKLSKYNISIPYKGKYVFCNTFSQKYLLLEPLLMELIEAVEAGDNLPDLMEIHPDLYDSLETNGFIIPEQVDEINKVRELITETDNKSDFYHLMVNPTMNCNFKCWYCYESHIKGSRVLPGTLTKIKLYIDNLFETMPGIKYFHLSFFGGEPLLNYEDVILPIIEHTHGVAGKFNIPLHTDFTTNGFLINEKIIADFVKYDVESLQISFDGNREHHDQTRFVSKERGSYDVIVHNLKQLVKQKIKVALRINYTEKNLPGLGDILESFADLGSEERQYITLSMNRVWQEQNQDLVEQVDAFQEQAHAFGFRIPDALEGNTVINSCYADKRNQSVINYNGDVYKCNARDFTKERREGVLGDGQIVWNDKYEERMHIKLKNKPCLECRILPICGGGCSQKAVENAHAGKEYCVHDFDEQKKKSLVLGMFLSEKLVDA